MEKMGVEWDDLTISYPCTQEEMLEVVAGTMAANVDLVVVDSIISLESAAQAAGTASDNPMAIKARNFSRFFPRLIKLARDHNNALVYTNQIRMNIGQTYGDPEIRPGGHALRHAASLVIRLSRRGKVKDISGVRMTEHCAKVRKSRDCPIMNEGFFTIASSCGIDTNAALVQAGRQMGILTKKDGQIAKTKDAHLYWNGAALWIKGAETFDGGKPRNGEQMATHTLATNPDLAGEIKVAVYEAMRPKERGKAA